MSELTIFITEKGGETRELEFENNQVTVGRVDANDIVLPKGNISKRHSKIVAQDDKVVIVDLRSTNGTYVNGDKISGPKVVTEEDKVYIGDFTLQIVRKSAEPEPEPEPTPEPEIDLELDEPDEPIDIDDDIAIDDDLGVDDDLENFEDLLQEEDDEEILIEDDLELEEEPTPSPPPRKPEKRKEPVPPKRPPAAAAKKAAKPTKSMAGQSVFVRAYKEAAEYGEFPAESDLPAILKIAQSSIGQVGKEGRFSDDEMNLSADQIAAEICGFGELQSLLDVSDHQTIYIHGPSDVFVSESSHGERTRVDTSFSSAEALSHIVRRLIKEENIQFDAENPLVDVRLADGTHVNAAHSTVCADGPSIMISRSTQVSAELSELVTLEVLSAGMATFLQTCVENRRNIVVCGGTRVGVATMVSALAHLIGEEERVVQVQRGSQTLAGHPQSTVLQPRHSAEARALVCHGIQMVPDRLIVHEMVAGECHEVVLAMAGGQNGTIASVHASSASTCLEKMESMVMSTGYDLPSRFVREQLATSIDVVLCVNQFADGSYKVTEILEVTGTEVEIVRTQDLFILQIDGFSEDGAVQGRFEAKGNKPRFYSQLARHGGSLDMAIFREGV